MTYRQCVSQVAERLRTASVSETPELDARVLVAHVAGVSSASLLGRWNDPWDQSHSPLLGVMMARRERGEPVAWIVGEKEFWGRSFFVREGVLVPRPDTETLVQAALDVLSGSRVADICCGTGCVGLTIALERHPSLTQLSLGDISDDALECARVNAQRWVGRTANVVRSDLMAQLPGPWDLIVSNPPYLTTNETSERVSQGWREPVLALDGGNDGLDLVRRLIEESVQALDDEGWLLIEAADSQFEAIEQLLRRYQFRNVRSWLDLGGQRRVTGGVRP